MGNADGQVCLVSDGTGPCFAAIVSCRQDQRKSWSDRDLVFFFKAGDLIPIIYVSIAKADKIADTGDVHRVAELMPLDLDRHLVGKTVS